MTITTFEYFNPNPLNKETGDCVVRALCKATDRSWVSVYDELCNYGRDFGVLPNSNECWEDFLDNNGFLHEKIKRAGKGQKSVSVDKFCKEHKEGTYVLRTAHHLVCVKDGKFHDLDVWPHDTKVYTYWRKVDETK